MKENSFKRFSDMLLILNLLSSHHNSLPQQKKSQEKDQTDKNLKANPHLTNSQTSLKEHLQRRKIQLSLNKANQSHQERYPRSSLPCPNSRAIHPNILSRKALTLIQPTLITPLQKKLRLDRRMGSNRPVQTTSTLQEN